MAQKPPEPDCRRLVVGSGSSSRSAVPGPTGRALIGPCCDPPRSRALGQPEKPSILSGATQHAGESGARLRRPSGLHVLSLPRSLGLGSVSGSAGPRRRPPSGLPSVPSQTRATTVAPAPTASTRLSAAACPASRAPSARRTSTSAPATRAATGPPAQTAWTATPVPARRASAASTARTTRPTARRGECRGVTRTPGGGGREAGLGPGAVPRAPSRCPPGQPSLPVRSDRVPWILKGPAGEPGGLAVSPEELTRPPLSHSSSADPPLFPSLPGLPGDSTLSDLVLFFPW